MAPTLFFKEVFKEVFNEVSKLASNDVMCYEWPSPLSFSKEFLKKFSLKFSKFSKKLASNDVMCYEWPSPLSLNGAEKLRTGGWV